MNVRKNIIIEDKIWDFLASKALGEKSSVSELIEQAVKKEYSIEDIYAQRRKAIEKIMLLRDNYKQKDTLDYKAMAHDGHKY